jgi:hypothetical protein
MDAFLDFVRRPDGTPVDPEVLAQFISLQQTGDYIPPGPRSQGPTGTINSTDSSPASSGTSSPPMDSASQPPSSLSAHPASSQTAVDAFFAAMNTPDLALGLLGLGVP